MFENFKARLHSNSDILKSWESASVADHTYSITKEFNLEGYQYSDICMAILDLRHVPEIMLSMERRESCIGDHKLIVSITISATEAESLTSDCQKLALSIEKAFP